MQQLFNAQQLVQFTLPHTRKTFKLLNGTLQPFLMHRLQKIVDAVHRKSPHRIFIVGRGKHNHALRPCLFDKNKRITVGQLDVQEQNVRMRMFSKPFHRIFNRSRKNRYLPFRTQFPELLVEQTCCRKFIFNNHCLNLGHIAKVILR